jgi:hypothetical protein
MLIKTQSHPQPPFLHDHKRKTVHKAPCFGVGDVHQNINKHIRKEDRSACRNLGTLVARLTFGHHYVDDERRAESKIAEGSKLKGWRKETCNVYVSRVPQTERSKCRAMGFWIHSDGNDLGMDRWYFKTVQPGLVEEITIFNRGHCHVCSRNRQR